MAVVGYYSMDVGSGVIAQVDEIRAGGHTAVKLESLTASDLAGIDVLYVWNADNAGYSSEYLNSLSDVAAAVDSGMDLVIFDRHVDAAETILPGAGAVNIVRNFSDAQDVNVASGSPSTFVNGPGGTINNSMLDGGNQSSHGFARLSTLPDGATPLLTTSNPTHVVAFSYRHGEGDVFYSTIPIDVYSSYNNSTITQAEVTTLVTNLIATNGMGGDIIGTAEADSLEGTVLAERIFGREGDDLLSGLQGADELVGGAGSDTIQGGGGNDRLRGSSGADVLVGGSGEDSFIFAVARGDRVADFTLGTDTLSIGTGLTGGLTDAAAVVATFATVVGSDVVFDFGDGRTIRLTDLGSTAGLADDLLIF